MLSKLNSTLYICLCSFLLFGASCATTVVNPSRARLLAGSSAQTWQLHEREEDGQDVTRSCDQDDTFTFNSDGTLSQKINTEPCDVGEQNLSGTWAFKGEAEDSLNITLEVESLSFSLDFLIEELSKNRLILQRKEINPNTGDFILFRTTYKR